MGVYVLAHCPAHPMASTENDRAAKRASSPPLFPTELAPLSLSLTGTTSCQANTPQPEKEMATKSAKRTKCTNCDLSPLTFWLVLISLQTGHRYSEMTRDLKDNCFCPGIYNISNHVISQCPACKSHQVFGGNWCTPGSPSRPTLPFTAPQMDFIGFPPA